MTNTYYEPTKILNDFYLGVDFDWDISDLPILDLLDLSESDELESHTPVLNLN